MDDQTDERGQARVLRDVTKLSVPAVGKVTQVAESPGTVLLDASGEPIPEVSEFFAAMLASGSSTGSLRSYGLALLRWCESPRG